jgi:hypothetical protein
VRATESGDNSPAVHATPAAAVGGVTGNAASNCTATSRPAQHWHSVTAARHLAREPLTYGLPDLVADASNVAGPDRCFDPVTPPTRIPPQAVGYVVLPILLLRPTMAT